MLIATVCLMKNFPFKILFLCIFLPPVCYILTLNGLERYLGKGGKTDFIEIPFAYSGRLYYQKASQARKLIVAIGTKNTQEKDLAYLGSMK